MTSDREDMDDRDVSRTKIDVALVELAQLLPSDAILTDTDVIAPYAHDESETPPVMPDVVVRARSTADVAAVMRVASRHDIPVTPRAAGTGRTGGAVPLRSGIVLSLEKMGNISDIDSANLVTVVEPGVVTGALHSACEAQGLFLPPDPNSLEWCTIGGNIAENAGGPRAFKYGVTRDYVLGLEVVTAAGEILRLGKRTVKGVTGYDLVSLIVGSEGTLAVVTEAILQVVPAPEAICTMLVYLERETDVQASLLALSEHGIVPRCVELLDATTLGIMKSDGALPVPDGSAAMLLLELDGTTVAVESELERTGNIFTGLGCKELLVARHGGEREKLWSARRVMSRSLRKQARFKLSEDIVVPRTQVGAIIEISRGIAERHALMTATYGHAGDGNVHVNYLWNDEGDVPRVQAAVTELFEHTIRLGGTLSGEHGIGVSKREHLRLEQTQSVIDLQLRVKDAFDPKGILNPGKIFPDSPIHRAC